MMPFLPLKNAASGRHAEGLTLEPARRRPACTVAVDLRRPSRLGAVAIDSRGAARAWGLSVLPSAGEPGTAETRDKGAAPADFVASTAPWDADAWTDRAMKIAELVRGLKVRPREIRLLLGAGETQVVGVATPVDEGAAEEALLGEGFGPVSAPAYATQEAAPGFALVARGEQGRLAALAEAVANQLGREPTLTPEALVLLPTAEGGLDAELDEDQLSIAARPAAAEPLVRTLVVTSQDQAAEEIRRMRQVYGLTGPVSSLGRQGACLARRIEEDGTAGETEPGSVDAPAAMPRTVERDLELAHRLACTPRPPVMDGRLLTARRSGERWARHLNGLALALGLAGVAFTGLGLVGWWQGRARNAALAEEQERVQSQLAYLRESATLAGEIKKLRSELAPYRLTEPALGPTLAGLEAASPQRIGWRKLAVREGSLELQVSATAPLADRDLESFRRRFGAIGGLSNPAWDPPHEDGNSLRLQTLRAALSGSKDPGGGR